MVFPMGKFKYQSTDNVGRLISVSGNMPESTSDVWAISPYNPSDRFHEGSLTTTIPSIQSAGQLCTGPFAAHSTDRNLAFYCLSGAIHFQVEKNGVDSISFKSAAGEALSGMAVFSFNKQNLPSYHDASQEESDSVLVKAPAGGFLEGKDYYAFCRPQVLSKGLIATVYTGQSQRILSFPNVTSVSRATLSDPILIQLKEELNPVSIISFADARMKADCVAALDKDQDGEVSVTEAATVTSLEGIFKSQLYTSFDEFRYFTGIKAIPDNFFSGWIMLKSISFPDGLSTIGKNAFLRCGELEAITFGHGLTFVDLKAFSQCPKLKTAHIPSLRDWLAIQFAFSSQLGNGSPFATSQEGHLYVDGQEITVADIPAGQKIIHNLAFFNCKEITTVILPGGLEETGYMAFRGCDKLTRAEIQDIRDYLSIDFSKSSIFSSNRTGDIVLNGQVLKDLVVPEGCTTIFSNAFSNSSITSVKFPDSLKRIEDLAFNRCKSLESIDFGKSTPYVFFGAFYLCTAVSRVYTSSLECWLSIQFETTGSHPFDFVQNGHLYVNGTLLTHAQIPEGITTVPKFAFENCTDLTRVSIPKSLTTVNDIAFSGCVNLKEVDMKTAEQWLKITYIDHFFSGSRDGHILVNGQEVKEFVVPSQTTSIPSNCFAYCKGITALKMEPTYPPTRGNGCFADTSFPIYVWEPCLELYKTQWEDIADRIVGIPVEGGGGDTGGTDIAGIISFADARMKADCVAALDKDQDGEVSVTEAATVTSLEGIFKSQLYTSFDEFRYFTGIKAIPDNFFSGWIMLKSISFPDGLSTIGKNAFLRCGELEAITFGHGLTFVDLKAFSQCPKLKTAHIPSLRDWLAIQFAFSSQLGNGSPFATSQEGHLYVDGQEITVADIPAGQKIIHNLAFFNCKEITTVILPGGLEETGYMAFRGCDKLTRAEIQDIRDYLSIDFSKSSIFSSNRTGDIVLNGQVLKDLVVPEGCTTIFSNAFSNSSITSVKFPDSLKRIEDLAFNRCKSLESIDFGKSTPYVFFGAFYLCTAVSRVYTSSLECWLSIQFETTGSHPFDFVQNGHLYVNGTLLTHAQIPEGITTVPKFAFENCTDLTRVSIPKSLTTVNDIAFSGCVNLKEVDMKTAEQWLKITYIDHFFSGSRDGHILVNGQEVKEFVVPSQTTSIPSNCFAYCKGITALKMEPTYPPTRGKDCFADTSFPIYVWEPCLELYKTQWEDIADRIVGMPIE